jgi:hypothetical protein
VRKPRDATRFCFTQRHWGALVGTFSLTACPPKRRTRERPAQSRKESSRDCAGTSAELGVFCDGQDKTVTLGELRRTSAEAKADEPNTSAEL